MNQLTAPTIRFRHAAAAIGVTRKTLRNWLARGQVEIETPSVGWASFSRLDLVRLAVTAELVGYGMGITVAFRTAETAVDHATHLIASYSNTPAGVLNHAFKSHSIAIIRPDDGKWSILHVRPTDQDWQRDEFLNPTSILLINLQAVADIVTERLVAALDEEFADDEESSGGEGD